MTSRDVVCAGIASMTRLFPTSCAGAGYALVLSDGEICGKTQTGRCRGTYVLPSDSECDSGTTRISVELEAVHTACLEIALVIVFNTLYTYGACAYN